MQGDVELGFAGLRHDDELGLIDQRGRVYDPASRHFLTPDPVVANLLSSQTYNPYSYVRNDPVNLRDPSGFDPEDEPGGYTPFDGPDNAGGGGPVCQCTPPFSGYGSGSGVTSGSWTISTAAKQPHVTTSVALPSMPATPERSATLSDAVRWYQGGAAAMAPLPFPLGAPGLPGLPIGAPGAPLTGPLGAPGPFSPDAFAPGSFVEPSPIGAPTPSPVAGVFGQLLSGAGVILSAGMIFSGDANLEDIDADGHPTNKRGQNYPSVIDPRTGTPIPFPSGPLMIVPKEGRVPPLDGYDRYAFIKEWMDRGYPSPPQGWRGGGIEVHHIQPRERGGDNGFDNLVPLAPGAHRLFSNYWEAY